SALPLVGPAIPDRLDGPAPVVLREFMVAGLRYCAAADDVRHIRVGEPVAVRAEPQNPHDEFAVRLDFREAKIGYIPRFENRTIAMLLAQGVSVKGEVTAVDPAAKPWRAVRVRVTLARMEGWG